MSQRSVVCKRRSASQRPEPVKRRRMLPKAVHSPRTKEAFCAPIETVLDVFSALDRSSFDSLQLACRRYHHLIESRLAEVCHREILRASITLDTNRPCGRSNRWKSERPVCNVKLISDDFTREFTGSAAQCLGSFARFLRHSVVTLQLSIDCVDGAHAFELAKHLTKHCRSTRIVGQLRLNNLKSLAHFRCESVLAAFTDVGALQLSFDDRHYTNCDSLLRACAQRNLYNVQISPLDQNLSASVLYLAYSEESVIDYCLGQEGHHRRVLRVQGHTFSKMFFAKLVHKALACTEKHEVRLIACNTTPQVYGDYKEYERVDDDGCYFEFTEAPMTFSVLFKRRGDDVDIVFDRSNF